MEWFYYINKKTSWNQFCTSLLSNPGEIIPNDFAITLFFEQSTNISKTHKTSSILFVNVVTQRVKIGIFCVQCFHWLISILFSEKKNKHDYVELRFCFLFFFFCFYFMVGNFHDWFYYRLQTKQSRFVSDL